MARPTNDDLRSFYDTHYAGVLGAVTLVTGSRPAIDLYAGPAGTERLVVHFDGPVPEDLPT